MFQSKPKPSPKKENTAEIDELESFVETSQAFIREATKFLHELEKIVGRSRTVH